MSSDVITLIWLVFGVLLLASELLVPGLIALFLGVAAILVAGLRYVGVVESLTASIFCWMGASVGLTLALRSWVKKHLPADTSRGITDEGTVAFGQTVEVLETVTSDNTSGRVRFQGTTWPATTTEGTIPKGRRARLVVRDDLVWIVEPLSELGSGDAATLDELLDAKAPIERGE